MLESELWGLVKENKVERGLCGVVKENELESELWDSVECSQE